MNNYSDLERLETVAQRLKESGVDITAEFTDWVDITHACAAMGEGAREAYHTICSNYPRYTREECDAKFDNCLQTTRGEVTLGTVMMLTKNAGIDIRMPSGRPRKSEGEKKKERIDKFQLMKTYIGMFCQVRFNVWKGRVELMEAGQEWRPLEERDLSTLFCRLKEAGVSAKLPDVKALLESRDYCQDYDAVREYLEALKPWTPETGGDPIRDFFMNHLEFNDPESAEFYYEMFLKWFVGMVALWLGLADENPIMPVFCGPQHIGKTYFIRHILPPPLREYYKEPTPRDPVDKDFIISLSEVVMIFLDEFGISSSLKSDTYKSVITSTQSNLRDAYAHFRQVRKRKASLIGATNHQQFIRDIEGNRRYVAVDLKATANLNDHPLDYDGAYAQALYLLQNGFNPKPTHEDSQRISEHNQNFMEPNDCAEILQIFLKVPDGFGSTKAMSAGDIKQELTYRGHRGKEFSSSEIGKAMKMLGFESKMIHGQKKYRVLVVDTAQHESDSYREANEFTDDIPETF